MGGKHLNRGPLWEDPADGREGIADARHKGQAGGVSNHYRNEKRELVTFEIRRLNPVLHTTLASVRKKSGNKSNNQAPECYALA